MTSQISFVLIVRHYKVIVHGPIKLQVAPGSDFLPGPKDNDIDNQEDTRNRHSLGCNEDGRYLELAGMFEIATLASRLAKNEIDL